MSIYSNVTEQDLINLRQLAEQQKEQRALKIKNRILKQTHDIKSAESLSPITKKSDEVKESTKKLEVVIKENNIPQLAVENTHSALPIENEQIQPGITYDTSLENTLSNMENNIGFINIEERDNGDIIWNGFPVEKMVGKKLNINVKIYDINPGIQKALIDTSNISMKKLNDEDRDIVNKILESVDFKNYKAKRGESKSGIYKQSKINFEKLENKSNLDGHGVKIIIPSNIIDIYTRLEILLGLKLSGHTDLLTEASNLIDELYKRGEIQIEQQSRNALSKLSTL